MAASIAVTSESAKLASCMSGESVGSWSGSRRRSSQEFVSLAYPYVHVGEPVHVCVG